MRKLRLAILSAALCALSGGFELCAQSAQFSYHLSNREVQTFAQDADGYIWIGTARGLNRYNGTNYAIFYAGSGEEELNSNNILSLCIHKELTEKTLSAGCGISCKCNAGT